MEEGGDTGGRKMEKSGDRDRKMEKGSDTHRNMVLERDEDTEGGANTEKG